MRLILREEVDHLGRRGDVVNVARGYGRNYLLPKRLAMEVTDDNLRLIEKEKKIYDAKIAKEKGAAEELASSLSAVKVSFVRKVHGDGEALYGSVSPTDVAEALEAKGFSIEKRKIALSEPVKAIGDYTASVKLHPEVTASFAVIVEKDESTEKEAAEKVEPEKVEPEKVEKEET